MCKKVGFKIFVFLIASNTVYGNNGLPIFHVRNHNDYGDDGPPISTPDELNENNDPISKWKESPVIGPSIISCQPGDVIRLYITQYDVPADFNWFQVEKKIYYGLYTGTPYEDASGQIYSYDQPPYIDIVFTEKTQGHVLTILRKNGELMRKILYTFKESEGGQSSVIYNIYYEVNWTTGIDYITMKGPYHLSSQLPPGNSGLPPLGTPPDSVSPTNATPPPNETKNEDEGSVSPPLVVGIVSATLTTILLMLLVTWKCRNRKTEPIYNEVQYAELQIDQANRPPPQKENVTYAQIKGVLMPKQTPKGDTKTPPSNLSEPSKNVTHSENKDGVYLTNDGIQNGAHSSEVVRANAGNYCGRRLPTLPHSRR